MSASANIRNIGIIAHIDAGKTTLAERILYYTHEIHRMGEVDDGAATMDFLPEEQERGITIAASCSTCVWEDAFINLIDTPGHVDFTIEVERTLRVLDGAVCVLCATRGVEPQSETVWRQSEKFSIPKIGFINKMDRVGADFDLAVTSLRERLGANPLALQMPLFAGDRFVAVADLIRLEKLAFSPADQGATVTREPLVGAELAEAKQRREQLLESLAEVDDVFLELYLGGGEICPAVIEQAVRRACLSLRATPVLLGSALQNIGVQPLLSAVVSYLPDPTEAHLPAARPVSAAQGGGGDEAEPIELHSDPAAPLAALVFKVAVEAGHPLAFTRIYSGTLHKGDVLFNASLQKPDKAAHIYQLHADDREELASARAGSVVALSGLHNVRTGHTLCSKTHPLLLEDISAYNPVISRALEPADSEEAKKLDEALKNYLLEDPTLKLELDEATGLRILSGMGELHLDVVLERLQREYGIAPRSGEPRVVFRETISQAAAAQATVDREVGGVRHQGEVSLRVEPLPRGGGVLIEFELPGDTEGGVDRADEAKPAGRERALSRAESNTRAVIGPALQAALTAGPLEGYEVSDVKITVTGYAAGSDAGLNMAAAQALRDALHQAAPALLEPVMRLEIISPGDSVGDVLNLLAALNGRVLNVSSSEHAETISAEAPMRNLFGFATALRSVSKGRAGITLTFDRFDVV